MKAKPLTSYAALLRGVNLGGKNKLPMKDLAGMFERAGCAEVRHYIQSGNVVFRANAELAASVPALVAKAIERDFGLRVPVVLRSAVEMAAVVRRNPFLAKGAEPDHCHVLFLADEPKKKASAALDPRRSPPDEFAVVGREVYLLCPNGVARTKLTNAYFDAALETVSTGRNWRTVEKLVEMTGRA